MNLGDSTIPSITSVDGDERGKLEAKKPVTQGRDWIWEHRGEERFEGHLGARWAGVQIPALSPTRYVTQSTSGSDSSRAKGTGPLHRVLEG